MKITTLQRSSKRAIAARGQDCCETQVSDCNTCRFMSQAWRSEPQALEGVNRYEAPYADTAPELTFRHGPVDDPASPRGLPRERFAPPTFGRTDNLCVRGRRQRDVSDRLGFGAPVCDPQRWTRGRLLEIPAGGLLR